MPSVSRKAMIMLDETVQLTLQLLRALFALGLLIRAILLDVSSQHVAQFLILGQDVWRADISCTVVLEIYEALTDPLRDGELFCHIEIESGRAGGW
jgi:hypothetical protein